MIEGVRQIPTLAALVPSFEIIVDDLVSRSDGSLQRRPLVAFPKLALWVLRDARVSRRFLEHLHAWAPILQRFAKESPDDAGTLMSYLWSVVGAKSFQSIRKKIIGAAPATEGVMATVAEELIQQGKVQGKAEGRAEAVLAVLEARGLTVTAEQRAQIVGCQDIVQLDRWLRLAATTDSAADLFSH